MKNIEIVALVMALFSITEVGRSLIDLGKWNPRLRNSKDAMFGEYPWMVRMTYKRHHRCGGVILDKRHILTIAQCVDPTELDQKAFSILAGEYYTNGTELDWQKRYQIERIVIHEAYNKSSSTMNPNVALLRLTEDIKFRRTDQKQAGIKAVKLPKIDDRYELGKSAEVAGYGSKDLLIAKVMQKFILDVIIECPAHYYSHFYKNNLSFNQDFYFCDQLYPGDQSANWGDAGSAAVIKYRKPKPELVGLVVGSDPGRLNWYMRVSPFLGWIKKMVTRF